MSRELLPTSAFDALVLGGSGAVGRFVLRRWQAASRTARVLSRQPMPNWAAPWSGLTWHLGGLPHTALAELPPTPLLISAGPLDALVEAIARGQPQALRRVVALSSLSIEWKRTSINPAERSLAQRLLQAEGRLQALLDAAQVELVLLRPGMIYGAGIDHSLSPLLRFARRWRVLPWPKLAHGLRCPVHADDVAAALCAAACVTPIPAAPLALPGAETLPYSALIDRLLRLAGNARRLPVPAPRALLRQLAFGEGRLASIAAIALRANEHQQASSADWTQLGTAPRGFDPVLEDFTPWS